jgi:hypothetical protein
MKTTHLLMLTAALAALGTTRSQAQYFGLGGGESGARTTVTIRADGSCVVKSESTQSRKLLEMQVKSWERYRQAEEARDAAEESSTPMTPPPRAADKPLTDQELTAAIYRMTTNRNEFMPEATEQIESLTVQSNEVRIVQGRAFATLREFLDAGIYTWGPTVLMPEKARLEATNGNLRLTFLPSKGAERYATMATRQWKNAKAKMEWKLILPGKVLTSDLPQTEGNSTSFAFDTAKPEELEKILALVGKPIAITAELGGLKLDEPLESGHPHAVRRQSGAPELPITDAGPGFVAEATGLTLSTVYQFPGAQPTNARPQMDFMDFEPEGTTVSAKLFPPKGRVIKSVSGVRLLSAKDDQGREIARPKSDGEDFAEEANDMLFSSGNEDAQSINMQVRLALPAPDAQTIEELQAEAVALTIGSYKELLLTNVQADAQKVIDLGELVPGAKLTILKVTSKKSQSSVQVRLEGPPAVDQTELKIKRTSRSGSSHTMQQQSSTRDKVTKRTLTVQSYDHEGGGGGPVTLEVRQPQDAKRERVQFKLSGLDLL